MYMYIYPSQKKIYLKNLFCRLMISLNTDEVISDVDYELIEAFYTALVDRDVIAMREVLYILDERMSKDCLCLEQRCTCGAWR